MSRFDSMNLDIRLPQCRATVTPPGVAARLNALLNSRLMGATGPGSDAGAAWSILCIFRSWRWRVFFFIRGGRSCHIRRRSSNKPKLAEMRHKKSMP